MRSRSATPAAVRKLRCAIYTRKSTEEGLEQDFNSLDAQREACAAYITSQRHEGWSPVPGIYDDGGYSGGNMERPALKALLADVALGKVDVIVVYKVDRLTRSLADFAKIVEVLDAKGASFVSVTQSFNTTTSMGRLTLNVLLSFAQFEREVTGERIRDKIAASKAKGMWMGGPVPLGYDVVDRKLVVNEAEAATVRFIFNRYLELGSGRALQAELDGRGIRSKSRIDRGGKRYGDQPISRGPLYVLLQNRIYIGEITHKGESYPGQHDSIIDRDTFERVQKQIAAARSARRHNINAVEPSMLAGLMRDEHGRAMSPTHACKGGRRYRYYTSQSDDALNSAAPTWRISAVEIERLVCAAVAKSIRQAVSDRVGEGDLASADIRSLNAAVKSVEAHLIETNPDQRLLLSQLVAHIDLSRTTVAIQLTLESVHPALSGRSIEASVPLAPGLVRIGKASRLVIPSSEPPRASASSSGLIRLLARAHVARDIILTSSSLDQAATKLDLSRDYAAALARLSYLAPDVVRKIMDGQKPTGFGTTPLIRLPRLPVSWIEQGQLLKLA